MRNVILSGLVFLMLAYPCLAAWTSGDYVAIDQCNAGTPFEVKTVAFGFAGCNDNDLIPYVSVGIACEPDLNLGNLTISVIARKGSAPFTESANNLSDYKDTLNSTKVASNGKKTIDVTAWVDRVSGYAEVKEVLIKDDGVLIDCIRIENVKTGEGFKYTNTYGNQLIFNDNGTGMKVL